MSPSPKINRPPVLRDWKDRWPVWNLSDSLTRLAQADSSSPDRPSSRRADHNNNSNGGSGCRVVQTLEFVSSQVAKIGSRHFRGQAKSGRRRCSGPGICDPTACPAVAGKVQNRSTPFGPSGDQLIWFRVSSSFVPKELANSTVCTCQAQKSPTNMYRLQRKPFALLS